MKFAVVGQPVAHSKSPAMHAAAYRALGLSHTYEAIECDDAKFKALIEQLKQGDFAGFSVTVPHKVLAVDLADEVADSARLVGAANTLTRDGSGKITAHNTDVDALHVELERLICDGETPLRGKTGVVIGTGGAARAAVAACSKLGARRVVVIGRNAGAFSADAERILRETSPSPGSLATTSVVARPFDSGPFANDEVGAIVQATTCGMTGGPEGSIVANAIDWPALDHDAVALDVVYAPAETPFLRAARVAGLRSENGLGMLARQGALAFELWLGRSAPFDAMRRAIEV